MLNNINKILERCVLKKDSSLCKQYDENIKKVHEETVSLIESGKTKKYIFKITDTEDKNIDYREIIAFEDNLDANKNKILRINNINPKQELIINVNDLVISFINKDDWYQIELSDDELKKPQELFKEKWHVTSYAYETNEYGFHLSIDLEPAVKTTIIDKGSMTGMYRTGRRPIENMNFSRTEELKERIINRLETSNVIEISLFDFGKTIWVVDWMYLENGMFKLKRINY